MMPKIKSNQLFLRKKQWMLPLLRRLQISFYQKQNKKHARQVLQHKKKEIKYPHDSTQRAFADLQMSPRPMGSIQLELENF